MDKVLEEHRQLRQMISDLAGFLQQPRPAIGQQGAHAWGAEMAHRLVTLHDALFRHFRYEEESGMAEDITIRHPRRSVEIERLIGEHPQMLSEIKELMTEALDYSEGHLLDDPALRTRLQTVLDHLNEHERAETDLVERAAFQETGGRD
jgi:uncharacterized protein (UPF0335 family)